MSSMVGRTPNAKSSLERREARLLLDFIREAADSFQYVPSNSACGGGLQDLATSSDEASSRDLVIPGRRACGAGQWPCGGIRSKTRRACACRVGGCWPDLRYAHFGWRTRVVDGAASQHAVGAHRRLVLRS